MCIYISNILFLNAIWKGREFQRIIWRNKLKILSDCKGLSQDATEHENFPISCIRFYFSLYVLHILSGNILLLDYKVFLHCIFIIWLHSFWMWECCSIPTSQLPGMACWRLPNASKGLPISFHATLWSAAQLGAVRRARSYDRKLVAVSGMAKSWNMYRRDIFS